MWQQFTRSFNFSDKDLSLLQFPIYYSRETITRKLKKRFSHKFSRHRFRELRTCTAPRILDFRAKKVETCQAKILNSSAMEHATSTSQVSSSYWFNFRLRCQHAGVQKVKQNNKEIKESNKTSIQRLELLFGAATHAILGYVCRSVKKNIMADDVLPSAQEIGVLKKDTRRKQISTRTPSLHGKNSRTRRIIMLKSSKNKK